MCARLQAHGVTIQRPPRDGFMAFVRSPDNISIELLQRGQPLRPAEPWQSMPNIGAWCLRQPYLMDIDEPFPIEQLAGASRCSPYAGLATHGRCGADDTDPCF